MSEVAVQAAEGVVGDLIAEIAQEAGDAPDRQEGAAETIADAVETEGFVLDPPLPTALAEFLSESAVDDSFAFDDEPDAEVESVAVESDEYVDPEVQQLRSQLAAEKKKREHSESLRLNDARKGWVEEARKFFPLAQPDTIAATSHRAFLKEAHRQHEAMKPIFEQALEARTGQVREEAREAWGRPMPGGSHVPPDTAAGQDRVTAERNRGSLVGTIKAMLETGQVRL